MDFESLTMELNSIKSFLIFDVSEKQKQKRKQTKNLFIFSFKST